VATKKKTFDALAASRRWRRATSRQVQGMTSEERIAFFNRRLEKKSPAPQTKAT
jgi:hypothetical protein